MKYSTETLEGVASLKGIRAGQAVRAHLEELLSYYNKVAAYEPKPEIKSHYSGRVQQLYELIDLFDNAQNILDKRNTQ
jgi:hypothetical protein